MLDKQYNLYSVDTGHFYSNHEKYLHDMNCKYRKERNYVNNKLPKLEKKLKDYGYSDDDIKKMKNNKENEINIIGSTYKHILEYCFWNRIAKHKKEKAKESKEK